MAVAENLALAERTVAALNSGDLDAFMADIHEDATWWLGPASPMFEGSDAIRQLLTAMLTALPDIRYELHHVVASDDELVMRYTMTGTNSGEFMGRPPTGRQVELHAVVVCEMKDGKRHRVWQYAAGPGLLEQLQG